MLHWWWVKDVDAIKMENSKIGQISEEVKRQLMQKAIQYYLVIDTQTHFREPGSTDTEDLHSYRVGNSRRNYQCIWNANESPTSNMKEFQRKLDLAKNRMYCNYAFYFGATADNADDLASLEV